MILSPVFIKQYFIHWRLYLNEVPWSTVKWYAKKSEDWIPDPPAIWGIDGNALSSDSLTQMKYWDLCSFELRQVPGSQFPVHPLRVVVSGNAPTTTIMLEACQKTHASLLVLSYPLEYIGFRPRLVCSFVFASLRSTLCAYSCLTQPNQSTDLLFKIAPGLVQHCMCII